MRARPLASLSLALLLSPAVPAQDNWPAFRGGAHAGVGAGKTLPAEWGPDRNVLFQADVPGRGWSSPVVWGDRVYLTTVATDAEVPVARKGLYIEDLRGKVREGEHRWRVLCLDARTGKEVWTRTAHEGKPGGPIHIKNTYASGTPVTDGERVYAPFGDVGLFCYDKGGELVWSRRWEPKPTRFGWGPASSPAIHGDRIFVVHDNEKESTLIALDKHTGKPAWEVKRDEKSNWASPYVWEHDGRTEVVTAGTNRVRSYGLDGKLLWEIRGMSAISIPTPFARDGLLYVTSGHVLDPHKPLYVVRPGASGDITPGPDEQPEHLAWYSRKAGPYHPTPVVYKGLLYVLYDRGFLACFDARTGEEVYGLRRLGGGASGFTASPWAYEDKVFCLSEDGDTFVIRAGREYKLLARNRLDEMAMATPATAGGTLFLRTQSKLYGLRQGAP